MKQTRVPIPAEISQQLHILRLFNKKVQRLEQTGFALKYHSDIPQVVAKFDNVEFNYLGDGNFDIIGRIDSWLQDFSQDEIDAFVLTYRIFTQNNDPISIGSLSRIYASSWMADDARSYFDEIRADINEYLSRPSRLMFGDEVISIGDLVEVVIYGGLAHTNIDKSSIFDSWAVSGIIGFVWGEFFAYAKFVISRIKYISEINEQILAHIDNGSGFFVLEDDL